MMSALDRILRRFQPPVVVGEVEKFCPTDDPRTVLITLRDEWGRGGTPPAAIIVAYPAPRAERLMLRRSFVLVCSPVNFRKDPDQRSGIIAIPLRKDNDLLLAS